MNDKVNIRHKLMGVGIIIGILPVIVIVQAFHTIAGFQYEEWGDWDYPVMRWWQPVKWNNKKHYYETMWWWKRKEK